MKQIKKLLCLMLAAIMVFTMVGCSSETGDTQESGNSQNSENNNNNTDKGEPRTITIGVWWDIYYDSTHTDVLDDPSYSGNTADQMRFDVVKKVEEKYNVKFEYTNLTYTGVKDSINTSILAGTPECDIYMCELAFGIPAAINGLAVDLNTVLDKDADILSDQTIMSYLDLGDGKACLMKQVLGQNVVEATYPLAFNKQLLEAANLEDPRELYKRGEWTWDKFVEYCQKLTKDTNGDGVNDQFGFTGFKEDVFSLLLLSNGASIASGTTEGLSSAATGEVLDFYSKLYNEYKVCSPYTWEDTGDVTRWEYLNGNIGFWPSAAWIASSNADYDWDGSKGSTLEFDTVYVQWPVGPSGNAETNNGKYTSGTYWFIPNGVEDPKLVYNVFEDLSNWYLDDTSVRDDEETLWWWYAVTGSKEELQNANFDVMFDIGSREQYDIYQGLGVMWDLESLINGTVTAAQFQETYKQEIQAAIDAYFK